MSTQVLRIHPADNVLVALSDLKAGQQVTYNGTTLTLTENIPAKHKFAVNPLEPTSRFSGKKSPTKLGEGQGEDK